MLFRSVSQSRYGGNGDVLAHDTGKVLSFGGQPEGEYLCDSMGLDRNVIVEYFNKIGNG